MVKGLQPLLMLPGPTQVPERVLNAMARPIIPHRGPEFHRLYEELVDLLKYVYQTDNPVYILTASGTGGIEFAASNFVAPGDTVLLPLSGVFAQRMGDAIRRRGGRVVTIDLPVGTHVEPSHVEKAFEENPKIDVVSLVFNETSMGVAAWKLKEIADIAKSHGALLIVDSISALGGVDIPTDKIGIDVHVSGSQKCLMGPPGLSFVAVSGDAREKARKIPNRSFYFDLELFESFDAKKETPFTPAVSLLVGMREALRIIREEGLPNVFKRHAACSEALYSALEAIGFKILPKKGHRSTTVVAAYPPEGVTPTELRRVMRERYGVVVAGGMGSLKNRIVRVGVMGQVSPAEVVRTVAAIEASLCDLGWCEKVGVGLKEALKKLGNFSTPSL